MGEDRRGVWKPRGRLGNGHISGQAGDCFGLVYPSGLKVKNPLASKVPTTYGKRDRIFGASKAALRRMREYLASIDWRAHPGHFVSLTYHPQFVPIDMAKDHLAAFRHRLEREFGEYLGAIWKEEFQDRGTVHFHLVVFWKGWGIPQWLFDRWVTETWYSIVTGQQIECVGYTYENVDTGEMWVSSSGEGERVKLEDRDFYKHGTKVQQLDTSEIAKFMRYCSKYLTKEGKQIDPATGEIVATGRIWGHWGDVETLVWAKMAFSRETLVQICRRLRRWGKASRYISRLSGKWSGFLLWGDGWQLCSLFRGLEYSISPG